MSAQLLIIAAAVWVLGTVLGRLAVVAIPVTVALLLCAVFAPVVSWLSRHKVPRALATAVALLAGVTTVIVLLFLVVRAIATGLPDLQSRLTQSYMQLRDWLTTGPLDLSSTQLDRLFTEATAWINRNRQTLATGAWGVFSTAGSLLAGMALALFALVFFVADGRRIWTVTLSALPSSSRHTIDKAGRNAFRDLTAYVRATVAVAAFDALGIGVGLWTVGVPLVVPLAALVFVGAFVPVVGAFMSGLIAVVVAVVTKGLVVGLIVLGIIVAVQQLEGNVFQPVLMGSAVKLHPLAIVLAIAVSVSQAGIAGALLAVPVLVTLRALTRTLLREQHCPDRRDHEPGQSPASPSPTLGDEPEQRQ